MKNAMMLSLLKMKPLLKMKEQSIILMVNLARLSLLYQDKILPTSSPLATSVRLSVLTGAVTSCWQVRWRKRIARRHRRRHAGIGMELNARVLGGQELSNIICFFFCFRFYGCNLNGNNFHEKDECETWCGGKIRDGQMIIKENDEETRQFCENYEKEHPGIKKMLEITNDVKNPQIKGRLLKVMNGVIHSPQSLKRHKRQIELDIDNVLNELQSLLENGDLNLETLSELLDQLENLDSTFETINEEIIPYLLEIGEDIPRRLWWSTVLSTNCSETKIRIRYHCLKNPIEIFNITNEMFDKICDDLIPAGIKKYYERSINIEGEPRQLMIEPLRVPTFLFAKTFIIGTYCNLGSGILHNVLQLDYHNSNNQSLE